MPYRIRLSDAAAGQLRRLSARDRRIVLDGLDEHLRDQPAMVTKNRKQMRPNSLAPWELRLGDLRAFYQIDEQPEATVHILAIGLKRGNRLWIDNQEYEP